MVMSNGRTWSEYHGVASSLSDCASLMVTRSSWSMVDWMLGPAVERNISRRVLR
jgi:hypothetical protein